MRKEEIVIGNTYFCRIGSKPTPIRIEKECSYGQGWHATNMKTNRDMRIKSAARLYKTAKDLVHARLERIGYFNENELPVS